MPGLESQAAAPPPALHFAGLLIHPMTVEQTIEALTGRRPEAPFAAFITPNIEHIYWRRKNPEFDAASAAAFVSTNDSRILHRIASLAGLELKFAPGAYVVDRLFREALAKDDPIAIIGATPEVVDRVKAEFGLTRVAHHIPPMGLINDEAAVREAIDFVAAHPSRYVIVAMGPPQSEQFCRRVALDGRATGLGLCVGSSLTVLTGQARAAPGWMERSGLVWLYRLAREPRRLWRRYLVRGLYGVGACARDILARRLGLGRVLA
jgi:exopolysaccharide biosynthesis WecB/TagA/CpsF family protein